MIGHDDDELFLWNGRLTRGVYTLLPARNIVRDSHHSISIDLLQAAFEPAQNLSSDFVVQ